MDDREIENLNRLGHALTFIGLLSGILSWLINDYIFTQKSKKE